MYLSNYSSLRLIYIYIYIYIYILQRVVFTVKILYPREILKFQPQTFSYSFERLNREEEDAPTFFFLLRMMNYSIKQKRGV